MKKINGFIISLFLAAVSISTLSAQISVPPAEVSAEAYIDNNGTGVLTVTYVIPEGYHQTFSEDFFRFEITAPQGVKMGEIFYPKGKSEDGLLNYYGTVELSAEISGVKSESISIDVHWQLCDENGTCFFPASESLSFDTEQTETTQSSAGSGLLLFILLAFAGGLLLNVMPCVLPVLSIKALSLVKQGGDDRKQILTSSLLYTAGVIASMLALAAAVIIIKAAGTKVGWGFQFQNRGFIVFLLTVIFVFGLSLFEVFTIAAPVIKSGTPVKKAGHSSAHFFSGVIAVLLATPCTAPFLGTAAGFAFSSTAPVIILIFFFVGLGLALPFLLIGFFPGLVKKLPNPGAWMNIFREVMAFLLMGTAVWLFDVLVYQSGPAAITLTLIYLLFLAVIAWLYGKISAKQYSTAGRTITALIAVAVISVGAVFLVRSSEVQSLSDTESGTSAETEHFEEWLKFSPELVNDAVGGNQPVFVLFSARWCMTCRTNETTVIFTEEIEDFFEENNVILIHGDYTKRNPEIDAWLNMHGRAGVPFYSWYPVGSTEAQLLPEIITKGMIKELPLSVDS